MHDSPGQQRQAACDQHPADVDPDHRVSMPSGVVVPCPQQGVDNTKKSKWNEQVYRAQAERRLRHQRVDEERVNCSDRYQAKVYIAQSPVSDRALATEKNLPRPNGECCRRGCR